MSKEDDVFVHISTNKIGSKVSVNTGFTYEEWGVLEEDEKQEIISQLVWESIDVSTSADE